MRTSIGVLAVLCLALSAVSPAAVISDDFGTDHNYLVDGVAGTIWDGFIYNAGLDATKNTVVTAAAATGGALNLRSSNGSWENAADDGLFLYIDIAAGLDFTANVYVSDYTFIEYHDTGLMARVAPGTTENYIMARYFGAYGVDNGLRSVDDNSTTNANSPVPGLIPYIQLKKSGSLFTIRGSMDGVTYTDLHTVDRPDMASQALQVGIYQATFSGNTGNVSFDNFSLEFASDVSMNPNPGNGETLVPINTLLSWDAPLDYTPVGYDVYVGTDPNLKGASELGWTGTSINPASDMGYALSNEITYYWRVDSLEPNSLGAIVHTGNIWSFTTTPAKPIITKDPVSRTVPAGTQIDLSVAALNTDTYTWYQSADAVVGDDTQVGTGNPLSLTINGVAEEGWYYCVASSLAGSDTSLVVRVMSERLVGYWDFEGDLADSVPAGPTHDGTAADPNFAPGVPGLGSQGYQFFGDGRVVTIAESADYFNFYPQGMTVSCWVKGQNPAIWDTLISKEYEREINYWDAKGFFLARTDAGAGGFGIRPSEVVSASGLVTVADWHHLAGVHDSVAGVIRIYVDGQLRGQASASGFNSPNLAPLIFGAESTDGTVGSSSATIDDVKIYNYALDSSVIAQQYVDVMGGYICVDGLLPVADLSGDCQVTLDDLAILALHWLESNRVE